MIRVVVDHELCGAHGMCQREAPEVFQVVDPPGGYARVEVLIEAPPEELRGRVEAAARLCPNQAIALVEE